MHLCLVCLLRVSPFLSFGNEDVTAGSLPTTQGQEARATAQAPEGLAKQSRRRTFPGHPGPRR